MSIRYSNQGATRNQPLSPELLQALSFLPELGIEMEVVSGGQAAKGSGGQRTGSTRHDHGNAADADFYMGGRKLDWNNPADQPIFQEIVKRARANGVTGIGAGDDYMGAGRMHIGFGSESVWGADGKGENAPDWLRAAYSGAPAGQAPQGGSDYAIQPQNSLAQGQYGQQAPNDPRQQQQAPQQPQLQIADNRLDPRRFMTQRAPVNRLAFT